MKDLIPSAVSGIVRIEIAFTHEPSGVIVGRLSFFNISMKLFRTFLLVLMSGVKIIMSSIMQSMYSQISGGNMCSRSFISEVKYAGETFSP